MQKSKYDIGEEAVRRFSLSYEDRATLALAEWVDDTFKRASVRIISHFFNDYSFLGGRLQFAEENVMHGHDIRIVWA